MRGYDGNISLKIHDCVPVKNSDFNVGASTFIDEFSRPADETEAESRTTVSSVTNYITNRMQLSQWTFIYDHLGMVIIVYYDGFHFSLAPLLDQYEQLAMGSCYCPGTLDTELN